MKKRNVLKELRKENNLTQKEVAEVIGITTSYYGMIESGVRTPNLEIAKALAVYFKRGIEEIFFNT